MSGLKTLFDELSWKESEDLIESLPPDLAESLAYDWFGSIARPEQIPPPGRWRNWVYLAGRGAGKTRSGAETMRHWIETGQCRRLHFVAPTATDVRDVMVEGESGILSICPPSNRPRYEPSKRRLTWPNGAVATTFSADEPERLRGPQCDGLWADEVCAWRYPQTWHLAMFGLRLGANPRSVVTTTPKPIGLLKELLGLKTTVLTKGRTVDNEANLAPGFLEEIVGRYKGTRLGRQELDAEILDDNPNALWTRGQIEKDRVFKAPQLARVVVAVDPAATETGDEIGIITAGKGVDGQFYVLDDHSLHGTPEQWGRAAVTAYHKAKADRIVYEANQGGDMVAHTLRTVDPTVPLRPVTATRGKITRAEPVSALYEQGRVHHVGCFPTLEDQLCDWVAGTPESPDRLDALVWAITELDLRVTGKIRLR